MSRRSSSPWLQLSWRDRRRSWCRIRYGEENLVEAHPALGSEGEPTTRRRGVLPRLLLDGPRSASALSATSFLNGFLWVPTGSERTQPSKQNISHDQNFGVVGAFSRSLSLSARAKSRSVMDSLYRLEKAGHGSWSASSSKCITVCSSIGM